MRRPRRRPRHRYTVATRGRMPSPARDLGRDLLTTSPPRAPPDWPRQPGPGTRAHWTAAAAPPPFPRTSPSPSRSASAPRNASTASSVWSVSMHSYARRSSSSAARPAPAPRRSEALAHTAPRSRGARREPTRAWRPPARSAVPRRRRQRPPRDAPAEPDRLSRPIAAAPAHAAPPSDSARSTRRSPSGQARAGTRHPPWPDPPGQRRCIPQGTRSPHPRSPRARRPSPLGEATASASSSVLAAGLRPAKRASTASRTVAGISFVPAASTSETKNGLPPVLR